MKRFVIHVWVYLQLQNYSLARDLLSEKTLTQFRCAAAITRHTQTNYAPFWLSASVRFRLPLWAGVDIRGGEWETATSGPLFSEMPRAPFESFALSFCLVLFSVIDQISQLCHNVQKGRLVNNTSASFNTIVATSPVVLCWLCDSPRTGCAWRTTPYIYVARTSNNRVIMACELYCCLLPQCKASRICRSGFSIATYVYNHLSKIFWL